VWLASRLRLPPSDPVLVPCAFRALFQVTERARQAALAAAPWGPQRPPFVVTIHVRASRYLSKDAYDRNNDNVFGCHPPQYDAFDFSDIWNTAHLVEASLVSGANRSSLSGVKWLLTSDSESLKRSARALLPDKILTTTIVARHNDHDVQTAYGCGGAYDRRQGDEGLRRERRRLQRRNDNFTLEEETIGELLLLSQADGFVTGKSRFSKTALMLCERCRRVVFYVPCTLPKCKPLSRDTIAARQTPPGWISTPLENFKDQVVYTVADLPDTYGAQRLVGDHVAVDKIDQTTGLLSGWVF